MAALILALIESPEEHSQMRACLQQAANEVVVVDSFKRAKAILRHSHSFDLIVSDVHLENGGSVFDFLKWVKNDPDLRSTPFVLFSLQPTEVAKYLADGVRTAARACGAAKYIVMETFDGAVFASEIAEVLPPTRTVVPIAVKQEGE